MKIYAAQYNSCIHESDYGTISLHRHYESACAVVRRHKARILAEWKEMDYEDIPEYEQWRVVEMDLED